MAAGSKMSSNLTIPRESIAEFCRLNRISRLAIFGSALREDFKPDSDIDILVSFEPGASHTLFDMYDMKTELEEIFGRKVDLVSQRGVENSRNHLRRKIILESAESIYET